MERNDIHAQDFELCRRFAIECRTEAAKRLIGQEALIDALLTAFIAGGHVLLEGVPGLAKTLAVKTFSEILGLSFKRIQFTPDLLPADVSGTLIFDQRSGTFAVRKGPVFSNIVLADEINRAPAKVQSALLEAMAEGQVTIGEETYQLPEPFLVLATQNPIDHEGTYSLPEAELDRFLMKLTVGYPSHEDEVRIVKTMGEAASVPVNRILQAEQVPFFRSLLGAVVCDDKIVDYIVKIVSVTRPSEKTSAHDMTRFITFGASPRAAIALFRCVKVRALLEGRSFVLPADVKAEALSVLRHRISVSFEAAADGITADAVISNILDSVPAP